MVANDKLKMFYMILLNSEESIPVSYFTEKLAISAKTAYNYLKELDFELKRFDLKLVKQKQQGYLLEGSAEEKRRFRTYLDQDYLNQDFTEARRQELLENLLMRDQKVSVRTLEEKYQVSKSSIVNDLEYVDRSLQKNELFLTRDKSGTYVNGKEQHIRSAKRNYVFEQFKSKISSKESYDLQTCEKILASYVHKNHMAIAEQMIHFVTDKLSCELMDDMYYYQIFIQFAIFLDRIAKMHFLVQTTYRPVVSELHRLKTWPVTVELSKWLKDAHHIELKEQDIRWLNARVSGVYHENTLHYTGTRTDEIREQLREFVETISNVLGENLIDDDELLKGLELHVVPMVARITNKIHITNPFLPQIKEQYPALFSVLVLAAATFENNFGVHLSDDEISFLLIHVQASIERLNLSKKIAIVIHSSGASAALVENRVKRNLPRFDVVETFNIDDLKMAYLDEFDFIISTIQLDYHKKPAILISPLVDAYDVRKINQIYMGSTTQSDENIKNLLLEMLDEQTLFINQNYSSSDEILQKISSILECNGYVIDGFLDSMLSRERISPTEVGNGIAIPHGITKYVLKEKIVIMTLKKPVLWHKEKVDIIICLAFSFQNKERSRKLISNIYRIIKSHETVQRIRDCKSRAEFYHIIENL
ncbi:BglG family transcription antiterminator [[Clostridium] innocuum]|uniref:BglG family transcription antiterminator n=1 Tax=Clostridium innocuum TaxID=1522 RepID=UPI000D6D60CE|nr:PTS sugar transporter subunit IIA [[Clostridium] innocuum]PWJ16293.1 transcriptional antiterminator [[Clostridium] innocuum]SSA43456.1 Transcriptional antiterminator [[Clostridium] innocuum]